MTRLYAIIVLVSSCCTSVYLDAQSAPVRYSYMNTEWYKTHGTFAEQEAEQKRLLDTGSIGLYVKNNSAHTAHVSVEVSDQAGHAVRIRKTTINPGATVDTLGTALNKKYVYSVTASIAKTTNPTGGSVPTVAGVRVAAPGSIGFGGTVTNTIAVTKTIATQKAWSIAYPTGRKIELVLDLVETPRAQPTLTLRQR